MQITIHELRRRLRGVDPYDQFVDPFAQRPMGIGERLWVAVRKGSGRIDGVEVNRECRQTKAKLDRVWGRTRMDLYECNPHYFMPYIMSDSVRDLFETASCMKLSKSMREAATWIVGGDSL